MKWREHSNLKGSHALCGASDWHWLNYAEPEKFIQRYKSNLASRVGTVLHDAAKTLIDGRIKITEDDWNLIRYILETKGLPRNIDCLPLLQNLIPYVNDAISYRMDTEVELYFSEHFYGTTDCIGYDEKNKFLRIHDLKTGASPAHMEQLLIYMAFFCLEYKIKPIDISAELRIYQNGEVLCFTPSLEDIVPVIDQIVSGNKLITQLKAEEA